MNTRDAAYLTGHHYPDDVDVFTGDGLMAMRTELTLCSDNPVFSDEFRIVCRNLIAAIEEATAADARLEAALGAYLETGAREVLLHQ